MSGSEVARLMAQIELETQAMQLALSGYAVVARHGFITRKYEAIGHCQEKLEALVGEEQASQLVVAAYEGSLEQEGGLGCMPHVDGGEPNMDTDPLVEAFASLKQELIEYYQGRFAVTSSHTLAVDQREVELLKKLLGIVGGRETHEVMIECWNRARRDHPHIEAAVLPDFPFSREGWNRH